MKWFRNRLSPIGLDVGTRSIKAVQVEHSRTGPRIVAAACTPREPGPALPETDHVERLLATLWRQGFEGQNFVLSVPPQHVLAAVMELPPRISGAPLDHIARTELARASRSEPDALEVAWWELPGGARAAEGTHVMAIGCRHADADALIDRFELHGAEVQALDAPATAIARACSRRPAAAGSAAAAELTAVLDMGWSAAQLLILRDGTPVYERSVKEHGLGSLQAALKTALSIEDDVCRLVLERIGCDPDPISELSDWELADRARSIVGAHVDAILAEVVLSLTYAERRFGSVPPSVQLTGGGALIPGLGARARERHSIQAAPILVPALIECAAAVQTICSHAPLVQSLGLALHDLSDGRPA